MRVYLYIHVYVCRYVSVHIGSMSVHIGSTLRYQHRRAQNLQGMLDPEQVGYTGLGEGLPSSLTPLPWASSSKMCILDPPWLLACLIEIVRALVTAFVIAFVMAFVIQTLDQINFTI